MPIRTYREVGEILGISHMTVFNIEKRALQKLSKFTELLEMIPDTKEPTFAEEIEE